MTLGVLVPTYRRPDYLERCLAGITANTRQADQVVVVARVDDARTRDVLARWESSLPMTKVWVAIPGQVQAINAGLDAVTTDITAITDDDAVPRPDWLRRIARHFAADPGAAGVGGRDWVHDGGCPDSRERRLVGRVLWFGRIVGNHHLGVGPARYVDILKGVNGAYRTEVLRRIRLDTNLRGEGAQVHWEVALGLELRQRGWRLIYDPEVAVDHYPAPRFDVDQRDQDHPIATYDAAFNLYWSIAVHMRPGFGQRLALAWQRWIGTPGEPGLTRAALAHWRHDARMQARAAVANDGRAAAWRMARGWRPTALVPPSS
jgi:cellulose synthase/poly-beta-1,6-N-acetylglucosamine synthase-like glycosyltransferase